MSREFGRYEGPGFFHELIRYAADDAKLEGSLELTKLVGELLHALYPVAYNISSAEEGDRGPEAPIVCGIRQLPELQRRLDAIKAHLAPYERVAEEAVRQAVAGTQQED